jgi:hypothetical protein
MKRDFIHWRMEIRGGQAMRKRLYGRMELEAVRINMYTL